MAANSHRWRQAARQRFLVANHSSENASNFHISNGRSMNERDQYYQDYEVDLREFVPILLNKKWIILRYDDIMAAGAFK